MPSLWGRDRMASRRPRCSPGPALPSPSTRPPTPPAAAPPPRPAPRHPFLLARFGAGAALPASLLARLAFRDEPARALFAGVAAHSTVPLERPLTASFGLMLSVAGHAAGWPVARGGSESIADA